jgi:hypothetical protein
VFRITEAVLAAEQNKTLHVTVALCHARALRSGAWPTRPTGARRIGRPPRRQTTPGERLSSLRKNGSVLTHASRVKNVRSCIVVGFAAPPATIATANIIPKRHMRIFLLRF